MQLAGIPIRDDLILELARLVDDPELANKLEDAYRREVKVLALTIPERARRSSSASRMRPKSSPSFGACCSESSHGSSPRASLNPLPDSGVG
jgi:hypothetical protein